MDEDASKVVREAESEISSYREVLIERPHVALFDILVLRITLESVGEAGKPLFQFFFFVHVYPNVI